MSGLEGTTLGRYRLKRKLGRGGMSEVYLAHDEHMHRDVAIKVVSGSHPEYAERFRRETRVLGNLQHDHILPAYDYGEQGPYQYLVMPYEAHGTLSDLLKEGPLTLEHASELLAQIASGLDYAHEHGIIHRDIKPSNILLRDDYYVYLADFGLVKAMEGPRDQDLTQTGTLLGTPEYMAPELSESPANTGTDLYALAILLYQMITGRVPFSGDSALSVYFKQLREHPLPPSYVDPAIPPAVDQVLMKALDKDPRRRYATANDLSNAYQAAIAGLDEMPSLYDTSKMETEDSAALAAQPLMHERKLFLSSEPLVDSSPAAVQPIPAPIAPVTPEVGPDFTEPTVQIPSPSLPAASFVPPVPLVAPKPQAPPITPPAPMSTYPVARRPARRLGSQRRLMTAIVMGVLFLIFVSMILAILAFSRQNTRTGAAQQATSAPTITTTTNTGVTGTPLATGTANAGQAQATQQAGTATAAAGTATSTAGATASATVSAQATQQAVAATATAATGGTPALDDSLASNTNNRWPDDGNTCTFMNGTYHVLVHQTDFFQPCISNALFSGAAIAINVSLLSGNDAGLLLRATNDQFYDFEINNRGQFFFRRHDAGKGGIYTYIIPETTSSAISSGQSNSLLVIANGSDFKLFINGTFVGERQDATYSSGQVGVAAGTLNPTTSAEGSFSNLKVYKI